MVKLFCMRLAPSADLFLSVPPAVAGGSISYLNDTCLETTAPTATAGGTDLKQLYHPLARCGADYDDTENHISSFRPSIISTEAAVVLRAATAGFGSAWTRRWGIGLATAFRLLALM